MAYSYGRRVELALGHVIERARLVEPGVTTYEQARAALGIPSHVNPYTAYRDYVRPAALGLSKAQAHGSAGALGIRAQRQQGIRVRTARSPRELPQRTPAQRHEAPPQRGEPQAPPEPVVTQRPQTGHQALGQFGTLEQAKRAVLSDEQLRALIDHIWYFWDGDHWEIWVDY